MKRILGLGILALAAVAMVSAQDAPKWSFSGSLSTGAWFQAKSTKVGDVKTKSHSYGAGFTNGADWDGEANNFRFQLQGAVTAKNYGATYILRAQDSGLTSVNNGVYYANTWIQPISWFKVTGVVDQDDQKFSQWSNGLRTAEAVTWKAGVYFNFMPQLPNNMKLDIGAAWFGANGKDGIANGNKVTVSGTDYKPDDSDVMPGFKLQVPNIINVAATFSLGQNGWEGLDTVQAKNQKFTFKNINASVDFGPLFSGFAPWFSQLAVGYYGRNLGAGKTPNTDNKQSSGAVEVAFTMKPSKFEIYYFAEIWLSAVESVADTGGSIGGYSRDNPYGLSLSPKSTDNKAIDMRLRVGYNVTDWFEPKVEIRWKYFTNSSSDSGDKGKDSQLLVSPELQFNCSANSKIFVGYQFNANSYKPGSGNTDQKKTQYVNAFTFGSIISF